MQTIAVDIDDVLSQTVKEIIAFSNDTWGTRLSLDDYEEDFPKMWQTSRQEAEQRVAYFIASGAASRYEHFSEAAPVLRQLAADFRLVVATSRRSVWREQTAEWLNQYFKDIFLEVHHAGIWDNPGEASRMATKADLIEEIGADYLIDDQLKHCTASAERGIETVLFGDYPWNKMEDLPPNVTRCADWGEVLHYFHARRRRS